jgi:hypothetical protein
MSNGNVGKRAAELAYELSLDLMTRSVTVWIFPPEKKRRVASSGIVKETRGQVHGGTFHSLNEAKISIEY